jgi:DNA-binding response OmpR family regulator
MLRAGAPRVLLIEDDDAHRAVVADTLAAEGYYVAGLDQSAGTLDSVRAQRPDLVITDMRMPDVDGVQVLTRLRGAGYTGRVLVLSAFVRDGDRFEGADATMAKPWDREALLATVARLIGPARE